MRRFHNGKQTVEDTRPDGHKQLHLKAKSSSSAIMIHIFQTSFYKWAGLAATRIALVALIIAFIPTAVHAQKCKKLEPAGVGQD
ncbi:MAG: hypothetical protein L0229_06560, partial [Blastocatellia bacterium]|nr:hypothetical protein [Blastocatellia bacterium]